MSAREYGEELLTRLLVHGVGDVRGALGAGLVMAEAVPSRHRRQTSGDQQSSPAPQPDFPQAGVQLRLMAATGVAAVLDPWQIAAGRGPLWQGLEQRQLVADAVSELADLPSDRPSDLPADQPTDSPHPSAREAAAEVKAVVVTQGEWGGSMPLLFTVYLSESAQSGVLAAVEELESVLSSAVAVVEYSSGQELKADQMLQMIQYRRVVEQAKGLVMGAVGGDGPAAFAVLSRASQHFNVRLRHLAVAIVEHVGGAAAEHPDDPAARVEPSAEDRAVAAQVWKALHADAGSGGAGAGDDAWRG